MDLAATLMVDCIMNGGRCALAGREGCSTSRRGSSWRRLRKVGVSLIMLPFLALLLLQDRYGNSHLFSDGGFDQSAERHQDRIRPMRAVRLHAMGDLRVERIDPPKSPAAGEVTLAVRMAGICGSDLHN